MPLSPQLSAALQRALFVGGGAFLVATLGAYFKTHDLAGSALVGLLAAVSVLGGRGVIEGIYDGHRALVGNVKPGDVKPLH